MVAIPDTRHRKSQHNSPSDRVSPEGPLSVEGLVPFILQRRPCLSSSEVLRSTEAIVRGHDTRRSRFQPEFRRETLTTLR